MRIAHCTVALVLLASLTSAAQSPTAAAPQSAEFAIFLKGVPIGTDQVTVTRTADGVSITGSERLGAPVNMTIRKAEIRYDGSGHPLECRIEGSLREQLLIIHTVVSGTTATTNTTQGQASGQKNDEIAADAVLLPNAFFAGYEGLAARLVSAKPGDELKAYIPPQAQIGVQILSVADDRIRTTAGALQVRRYRLRFLNPGKPSEVEIWAETSGRLLRFSVMSQGLDVVRTDIASVAARREPVARPNDEQVRVPADGFTVAGTLSRPATQPSPGWRFPAVVLVGKLDEGDREETTGGVPVFGQLASALADAGFLVIRYDKRGIGQSGGRSETATVSDYAEDLRAVVKFLKNRKDVQDNRIVVLGYAEGAAVAMTAAMRDKEIRALVLVAAAGRSGSEAILDQQVRSLAAMNIPAAEKQAKIGLQRKIHLAALTGKGWEGIPPDVRRQAETPWFQTFLAFDPGKLMPKLRQPILILHGERDRQIDPSNADILAAMARARKGEAGLAVTLVKIPGVNHLLLPATTGESDEYAQLANAPVSPAVVPAIDAWLKSLR
ncbi:MAG TPA: alpha/beta fold hydrolase [Vicinamibacterales bacterium]|jgi:hypothetical protein